MKDRLFVLFLINCLISANIIGQEIDLNNIYKNKDYDLLEDYLKSDVSRNSEELYLGTSSKKTLIELSNVVSSLIKSVLSDSRRRDYWVINSDTLKVLMVNELEFQDSSRHLKAENDSDLNELPKSPSFPFYNFDYYSEKAIKVESIIMYHFLTKYLEKEPIWITDKMRKELDRFIKGTLADNSNSRKEQNESLIEFYNRAKFINKYLVVKLNIEPIYFTSEIHLSYVIVDKSLEEAQIGYYTPWSGGIAFMKKTDDVWNLMRNKVLYVE